MVSPPHQKRPLTQSGGGYVDGYWIRHPPRSENPSLKGVSLPQHLFFRHPSCSRRGPYPWQSRKSCRYHLPCVRKGHMRRRCFDIDLSRFYLFSHGRKWLLCSLSRDFIDFSLLLARPPRASSNNTFPIVAPSLQLLCDIPAPICISLLVTYSPLPLSLPSKVSVRRGWFSFFVEFSFFSPDQSPKGGCAI